MTHAATAKAAASPAAMASGAPTRRAGEARPADRSATRGEDEGFAQALKREEDRSAPTRDVPKDAPVDGSDDAAAATRAQTPKTSTGTDGQGAADGTALAPTPPPTLAAQAAAATPPAAAPTDPTAALAALLSRLSAAGGQPLSSETGETAAPRPQGPAPDALKSVALKSVAGAGDASSKAPDGGGAAFAEPAFAAPEASLIAADAQDGAPALAPVAIGAVASERHLAPAAPETTASSSVAPTTAPSEPAPRLSMPAQSIRLTLDPGGLGEVDVSLRLRAGRLDARLTTQGVDAAAALETRRGDIADALRRAGYEIDGAGLTVALRGSEKAGATREDAPAERQGREQGQGQGQAQEQGRKPTPERREGRTASRATRPAFDAEA
jgi:flagellar hook-length control protein FliK